MGSDPTGTREKQLPDPPSGATEASGCGCVALPLVAIPALAWAVTGNAGAAVVAAIALFVIAGILGWVVESWASIRRIAVEEWFGGLGALAGVGLAVAVGLWLNIPDGPWWWLLIAGGWSAGEVVGAQVRVAWELLFEVRAAGPDGSGNDDGGRSDQTGGAHQDSGERELWSERQRAGWAYEALGVDPDASDAEVNAAYRDLMKRCHPDLAGGSAADKKRRNDQAAALNRARDEIQEERGMRRERAAQGGRR